MSNWRESPLDIGIPFEEWRPQQVRAIERALNSEARVIGLGLPAGSGKSLVYMALPRITGARAAVLVASRGLQDQLSDEFQSSGLFDIRGRANYECQYKPLSRRVNKVNCDDGQDGCIYSEDQEQCPYKKAVRAASRSQYVETNYQYWFNANRYSDGLVDKDENGAPQNPFSMLVCDECFVAGTLVDNRRIEEIEIGDYVTSYDETTCQVKSNRVVTSFKRPATRLLRLRFTNNTAVVCTANHPFLTDSGWIKAGDLTAGDKCLVIKNGKISERVSEDCSVYALQDYDRNEHARTPDQIQGWKTTVLQPEMQRSIPEEEEAGCRAWGRLARPYRDYMHILQGTVTALWATGKIKVQKAWLRCLQPILCTPAFQYRQSGTRAYSPSIKQAYEGEQSNVGPSSQSKSQSHATRNWTQASNSRREWEGGNDPATSPMEKVGRCVSWPGIGTLRQHARHSESTRTEVAEPLQDRYRDSESETGDRGRRQFPWAYQTETTGSEKGYNLGWVGLESVEVFESSNPERFREVCPDGFVYNLEVEDTHTYTVAGGFVVHNCHALNNELERFLEIRIWFSDIDTYAGNKMDIPPNDDDLSGWAAWAQAHLPDLKLAFKDAKQEHDTITTRKLEGLVRDLGTLSRVKFGWVVQVRDDARGVKFTPLWPGHYAESTLFCGIPKIILVSATMNHKTITDLGIKKGDYELFTSPCSFPPARCPVYAVPGVRLNRKTKDEGKQAWVASIDDIIARHLDRKGILHTVSYERQQYFLDHSRHRGKGIFHANEDGISEETNKAVERFRAANAPAVLVSPALATGWSFPGTQCEYQIVGKIPYPDTSNKVAAERTKRDPRWPSQIAMVSLAQTTRRGMRASEDRCVTFIVDESWAWFMGQNSDLAPEWLRVQKMAVIPAPARKL